MHITDRDVFGQSNGASSGQDRRIKEPRRFISSILGGEIPYGSHRGHVLTQAERKQYLPVATEEKKSEDRPLIKEEKDLLESEPVVLPSRKSPSPESIPSPGIDNSITCQKVSVIQRTPSQSQFQKNKKELSDITIPNTLPTSEPEQDQPIDYAIAKKRGETEDEETEKKIREQRRTSSSKIANGILARPVLVLRNRPGSIKIPGIINAAAGHGRSTGSSGSAGNSQSSGGSGNFSSGAGSAAPSSGGGGALGGGSGSGGNGRDGRSNYGPNSPPTGSLPPFYETLGPSTKNGQNTYNANGNFSNEFNMINGFNMDCENTENANTNFSEQSKQYSLMQNAHYGLALKDEEIDYENKLENLGTIGSYGSNFDESMVVDMGEDVIDNNQFYTTLTFAPNEGILGNLSDSTEDFASLLNNHVESITDSELRESSSITPDSVHNPVDIESLAEQVSLSRQYYEKANYLAFASQEQSSTYNFAKERPDLLMQLNPALLQHNEGQMQQLQIHVQLQQRQQILSPVFPFTSHSLDLDSPTGVSLPSPGGNNSLDSNNHIENSALSPAAAVSLKKGSINDSKIQILQQRVSII